MRPRSSLWQFVLLITSGLFQVVSAADGFARCQQCQSADGYCFQDVVSHRCVLVPDTKAITKTVYECKEVPYCVHRLPKVGECGGCLDCLACPRYKKILVKREVVVTEICTTKCVVEEFVERVPGPCCHCGHNPQPDGGGDQEPAGENTPRPPVPQVDARSVWLPPADIYFPPVLTR